MATKSETMIKFCAETPLGAIIEFVALAARGSVVKTKVSAASASYVFEKNQQNDGFVVTVKNSKQHSAEEFRAELVHVLCALKLLGAREFESIGFSKGVHLDEVLARLDEQNVLPLVGEETIEARTNLTLNDLDTIWQALAVSVLPVGTMMCDTEFTSAFPYADLMAGTYVSLRHASGCEISLETRRDDTITAHRIDAPSPVTGLVARLIDVGTSSLSCNGKPNNKASGIFDPDGYRGTDESRWRVSKMLGSVPLQHKPEVFAWAANVINSIDEFHSTRGGVALPKSFECRYGDMRLVADHNLKFEQR